MATIGSLSNLKRLITVPGNAARYLPEPATRGVGMFRDVMNTARDVGGALVGGVETAAGGDFGELIQLQIGAQKELQTTTMVSNVEKSKHESKMAALRNIRVS